MIAIIEGCGTNVASIEFALQRFGVKGLLTSDEALIRAASHVIIPGVSTAARALAQLTKMGLLEVIPKLTQPVLGICSGMQILFEWCEEGNAQGLGIFPGKIEKLKAPADYALPHMGWNTLETMESDHRLLKGCTQKNYVYYVHSFAATDSDYTIAKSHYGQTLSAIVAKDNFYGMQFHPEKSGKVGAQLLQNFLNL